MYLLTPWRWVRGVGPDWQAFSSILWAMRPFSRLSVWNWSLTCDQCCCKSLQETFLRVGSRRRRYLLCYLLVKGRTFSHHTSSSYVAKSNAERHSSCCFVLWIGLLLTNRSARWLRNLCACLSPFISCSVETVFSSISSWSLSRGSEFAVTHHHCYPWGFCC